MKKEIIYLDNASTTPCFKEVVKSMNDVLLNNYGNPSSPHEMGEKAREILIDSKRKVASLINSKPYEIIFTSGGTESNNLAIRGLALAYPQKKRIIISSIEHSSVYEECEYLKSKGYEIIEVPVDNEGFVDLVFIENHIDKNTLLVSIMHANNEFGTIQDISSIGEICNANDVLFHTDAVQSFGKEKIDVENMKIDLLSASAHKIGGPKGIGFLYVRDEVEIRPLIVGGSQENGLRGGTENLAGIVGFAKAIEISKNVDQNKIKINRDYFIAQLEKIGGKINGSKQKRLSNNINVSFLDKDSEKILLYLSEKGIMCSTRSACSSKQKKENRVLNSIGLDKKYINGTIRFSLSSFTKKEEIDKVVRLLKKI